MKRIRKPAHISRADWDAVDFPPLTDEDLARMRPAHEVFPDIDKFPRPRTRGRQKTPTKVPTTIRLDRDVLTYFRASGRGWQSRVNDMLRRAVKRGSRSRGVKG